MPCGGAGGKLAALEEFRLQKEELTQCPSLMSSCGSRERTQGLCAQPGEEVGAGQGTGGRAAKLPSTGPLTEAKYSQVFSIRQLCLLPGQGEPC